MLFAVLLSAARNTLSELLAGGAVGPIFAALLVVGLIYNLSETAFNNTGIVGFVVWLLALRYPFEESVEISAEMADDRCSKLSFIRASGAALQLDKALACQLTE